MRDKKRIYDYRPSSNCLVSRVYVPRDPGFSFRVGRRVSPSRDVGKRTCGRARIRTGRVGAGREIAWRNPPSIAAVNSDRDIEERGERA